jgi:dephospho-CoA kinase
MIVGVTGKRLSGKNEVAEHLRDRYGFLILDFTEGLLKPILIRRKKPIDRMNLTGLAVDIRKRGGADALVRILCRKISPGRNYVIAGMRYPEEVSYMRKTFGNRFVLMAVEAPDKARFRRIKSMKDSKDSGMSMKEFIEAENLPNEIPIPKTMKLADFTLRNAGPKGQLRKKVDGIMEKIKYKTDGLASLAELSANDVNKAVCPNQAPDGSRTHDLLLTRQPLYTCSLLMRAVFALQPFAEGQPLKDGLFLFIQAVTQIGPLKGCTTS